eukprot:m.72460 g.72460  ORF g.72460 m.72460 type:complete len:693 (+) comp12331_c0_seq1:138-2216(+)
MNSIIKTSMKYLICVVTAVVVVGDDVDMDLAHACLRMTHHDINLEYPSDARQHFEDIHNAMKRFYEGRKPHCGAGFCGPWMENNWISTFSSGVSAPDFNFKDHFGPFIPLFIPWTDIWVGKDFECKYPNGFVDEINKKLRKNVAYITVVQNDEGLPGKQEWEVPKNLLTLSSGGYGHIPIPLLKQPEDKTDISDEPDYKYPFFMSFVGAMDHAPNDMREKMWAKVSSTADRLGVKVEKYLGDNWRDIMIKTAFNLAPRGFGRTSYHLCEIMQRGMIPVHVYVDGDIPWVPYKDLYDLLGFATDVEGIPSLMEKLNKFSTKKIQALRRKILYYRKSHFTYEGVMNQIGRFMQGKWNDLRCQQLPSTVRGSNEEREQVKDKEDKAEAATTNCEKQWDPSPLRRDFWAPIAYFDINDHIGCHSSKCLQPVGGTKTVANIFQVLANALIFSISHPDHPTVVLNSAHAQAMKGLDIVAATKGWGCFSNSDEQCNKEETAFNFTSKQLFQGKFDGLEDTTNTFPFANFLGNVVVQLLLRAPQNIRQQADEFLKEHLMCQKFTAVHLSQCVTKKSSTSKPYMRDPSMQNNKFTSQDVCTMSDAYLSHHLKGIPEDHKLLILYDKNDEGKEARANEIVEKFKAVPLSQDHHDVTFVQMILALRSTHFIGNNGSTFSKIVAMARAFAFQSQYLPSNIRLDL